MNTITMNVTFEIFALWQVEYSKLSQQPDENTNIPT